MKSCGQRKVEMLTSLMLLFLIQSFNLGKVHQALCKMTEDNITNLWLNNQINHDIFRQTRKHFVKFSINV